MVTPTQNPLGYLGIDSPNPRNTFYRRRAPTSADFRAYTVGDRWIDLTSSQAYILTSKSGNSAFWFGFSSSPISGSGTTVGATSIDIVTFPLGLTPGAYSFICNGSAFDSVTPSGFGMTTNYATVRTDGVSATIINLGITGSGDGPLAGASINGAVVGNNFLIQGNGVALTTVNWNAQIINMSFSS